MRVKLTEVGGRLTLLIPDETRRSLALEPGSTFEVDVDGDRIVLTMVDQSHDERAKMATRKMIVNHKRVLKDIED